MSAIYGFWIPWSFDQVLGSGLICQSGKNTLRPLLPEGAFSTCGNFPNSRVKAWKNALELKLA